VAREVAANAGTPPREIVAYLLRFRPVLRHAIQVRRQFIEQVGLLIEEVRRADPITISRQATRLGLETVPLFRDARSQVSSLMPPPECQGCNQAIAEWLDLQIAACGLLNEIGQRRDVRRVREVQEHLGGGRVHAVRFNDEYARIKEDLRARVQRVLGPRRRKGGFLGFLSRLFDSA